MRGAREAAERLGYAVQVMEPAGARRSAGSRARLFATAAASLRARGDAVDLCHRLGRDDREAAGGRRCTGRGGRNQEFALAFALKRPRLGDYVFASVGTDGIDGPTDAAGAIVDRTTLGTRRTPRAWTRRPSLTAPMMPIRFSTDSATS